MKEILTDTDLEDQFMVTKGDISGQGINYEVGINIYIVHKRGKWQGPTISIGGNLLNTHNLFEKII